MIKTKFIGPLKPPTVFNHYFNFTSVFIQTTKTSCKNYQAFSNTSFFIGNNKTGLNYCSFRTSSVFLIKNYISIFAYGVHFWLKRPTQNCCGKMRCAIRKMHQNSPIFGSNSYYRIYGAISRPAFISARTYTSWQHCAKQINLCWFNLALTPNLSFHLFLFAFVNPLAFRFSLIVNNKLHRISSLKSSPEIWMLDFDCYWELRNDRRYKRNSGLTMSGNGSIENNRFGRSTENTEEENPEIRTLTR